KNFCITCLQQQQTFPLVKQIFTGGDKVPLDIARITKKVFPHAALSIFYGPSEATILSSHYLVDNQEVLPFHYIGKPFSFASHLVLNEHGKLIPPYTTADLLIGGACVGLGYVHEELSAEKFIQTQYGRFYKTGDKVKYDLEGNFIFLGRNDKQLKIRGKRLELSEIEVQISKLAGMKNFQLLPIEKEGEAELVLFHNSFLSSEEIQKSLEKYLPAFMIPQSFYVEHFPYNINGKIDVLKLKEIYKKNTSEKVSISSSLTPNETLLLEIVQELLQHKQISIESDFFSVGGHSIKAAQLVSRIYQQWEIKIQIAKIFEVRTLRRIAQEVDNHKGRTKLSLQPAPLQTSYPISPIQQRLLILEEWEQGNSPYLLSFSLEIKGALDILKLNKVINQLVEKYEILRTYFPKKEDNWVMKISPPENIDILSKKYPLNQFDLTQEPPIFFHLNALSADTFVLDFQVHHALLDGISIQLLIAEILQAYQNQSIKTAHFQYKDYAYYLSKSADNQDLTWWITQFSSEIPVLAFPTNYARPIYQQYEGEVLQIEFPRGLSTKIYHFIQGNQVTLQQFMLANFYILLYKYSQQNDLVVGIPFHGRTLPECEEMLGMFVNMLPLRLTFSPEMPFADFLQQLVAKSLVAQEKSNFRLEELVEALNPPRNTGRNPLFDVSFVVQNLATFPSNIGDLEIRPVYKERNTSLFDFSFEVIPHDNKLTLNVEYATSLFTKEFISEVVTNYFNLVENTSLNYLQSINYIPILIQKKQQFLLEKGNFFSSFSLPLHKNVFELFEENATKNPHKIALIGQEEWTYQALLAQVNTCYDELISVHKIQKGDYICLQFSRKITVFAWLLASWKCEAVVVPLDVHLPEARLDEILTISQAKCLISQQNHEIKIVQNKYYHHKEYSTKSNYIEKICYCIFTSGSTGKPKGVMISHQNLLSAAKSWCEIYPHLSPVVLQLAGFSFDVFMGDLARALLNNGTLVLADETERLIPETIFEIIESQEITHLETTPVMVRMMMQELKNVPQKYSLSALQYLIVGSDIWTKEEYLAFEKTLPAHLHLINSYGLTECTVDSTFYLREKNNDENEINILPIGKPLPNTKLLILDKYQQVLPANVWGELYIGGAAVGLGYLQDEAQTNLRYVKLPAFGNEIFYKTGDIACWLADGNVLFQGRNDNLVKIRGFRVELGEIERVLKQDTRVNDAVVLAIPQGEENSLFAFYKGNHLTMKELREVCAKMLPPYMIPEVFTEIEQFPMNVSGKINRKELLGQAENILLQDVKNGFELTLSS
ncbi:MAG: amino acid adenylation domain-containing protein, partial [Bacteroidia bacterium]